MADHDFDGTNPLLEALGDEPTVRDVTLFNQSYKKIIEPLTGVHIQPGQTAVIRVTGDAAFNQIKGNVDQLKALKDYDVLAMSVDVVDEPSNSWTLLNATLNNGVLTYARDPSETEESLFAEKALALGETVTLDFKVANEISSFTVCADDGINGDNGYTVNSAVIIQDLDRARLIAQQDWDIDYRVNLIDQTTYMASIYRSDLDTVILRLSDLNGSVLKERTVTIQNVELKRIWISVGLINNVEFSATLLSTFDNE